MGSESVSQKKQASSHFGLYRSKTALQTPLEKQQAARADLESRCQTLIKGYKAYQAEWHLPLPDCFQVDLRCNPMQSSYQQPDQLLAKDMFANAKLRQHVITQNYNYALKEEFILIILCVTRPCKIAFRREQYCSVYFNFTQTEATSTQRPAHLALLLPLSLWESFKDCNVLPWRSRIRLEEARSRKKSFLHIFLILMTSVSLCRVVSLCVLLVELLFLGAMPLAFKETELKNNYSLSSIRFQDLFITWYMNSIYQYIQILLTRSTLHFKCNFFFLFVSLYCCNRFH